MKNTMTALEKDKDMVIEYASFYVYPSFMHVCVCGYICACRCTCVRVCVCVCACRCVTSEIDRGSYIQIYIILDIGNIKRN